MNYNKYFYFLFLIITLCCFSCQNKVFYEEYSSIKDEVWHQDSVLQYSFEIKDSMEFYNMYVNVRNTSDYPYQNMYIFFTTQFPDGQKFTDTLGCILCDVYGNWYGKGSGRIYDNRFTFKHQVRFPQKGVYKISVCQAMRDERLKGISDFGISLNYYEKEKKP